MKLPSAGGHDDEIEPPESGEMLNAGVLVIRAFLDMLSGCGARISAKERATRAIALEICFRHHSVHGKSVRQLAKRIGVSYTALARRVRLFTAELRTLSERVAAERCEVVDGDTGNGSGKAHQGRRV